MIKKIAQSLFELFMVINMFIWYDLFFKLLLKGKVSGLDRVPKGGFIVAANHVSYFDWIILYTLFRKEFGIKIRFLGKAKLTENRLFRWYLTFGKTIVVDYRKSGSVKNAYAEMNRVVKEGGVVGIFPEGTRSKSGTMLPGNEGVGGMVLNADAAIVPVGLQGFFNVWPNSKRLPRLAKCSISIGAPIRFDMSSHKEKREARKIVSHMIMKEIAVLTNESYDHVPETLQQGCHSFVLQREGA